MHLYKTIKNFLLDQKDFIDLWDKYIHVYGLVDILKLEEKEVYLVLEGKSLEILGYDFRVIKLTKKEVLIEGNVEIIKVIK